MSQPSVFIIRNQHDQFLSRHSEWIDGSDRAQLYRTVHRDEAVNTVFEVSTRDIQLRAEIIACTLDSRGQPELTAVAEQGNPVPDPSSQT